MHTSTLWLKFGSLSLAMTLKIMLRSLKPNQLFIMSQCYIHANSVKIHPPVHEILCKQESVTLTTTLMPTSMPIGSAPKTIYPPPNMSRSTQCHHLNKLGSSRVPDAAYKLSRSSAFWVQRRRFFKVLPFIGMVAILVM